MKQEGQIYVKNKIAGRNVYTKLTDIIEVNNKGKDKEKYENLGKAVDDNFKKMKNKLFPNMNDAHKKFVNKVHSFQLQTEMSYSPQKYNASKKIKNIGMIIINQPTTEGLLINSFKKALKDNISPICDYEKCITEIDEKFKIGNTETKTSRFEKMLNKSRKNSEKKEKKIKDEAKDKKTNQNKDDKQEILKEISELKEISVQKKTSFYTRHTYSKNNFSKKLKKASKNGFELRSRLKGVLQNAVLYLHCNNITLEDFHINKVLPKYAYSRQSNIFYIRII